MAGSNCGEIWRMNEYHAGVVQFQVFVSPSVTTIATDSLIVTDA